MLGQQPHPLNGFLVLSDDILHNATLFSEATKCPRSTGAWNQLKLNKFMVGSHSLGTSAVRVRLGCRAGSELRATLTR